MRGARQLKRPVFPRAEALPLILEDVAPGPNVVLGAAASVTRTISSRFSKSRSTAQSRSNPSGLREHLALDNAFLVLRDQVDRLSSKDTRVAMSRPPHPDFYEFKPRGRWY